MLTITCHPYTAGLVQETVRAAGDTTVQRDGLNSILVVRGGTLNLLKAAAMVRRLGIGAKVEISDDA